MTYEVGKFKLNLERLNVVGKLLMNFFLTSLGSFQLQRNFLTSDGPTSRSFQLSFPTTRISKILSFQPGKLENTRYRYQENLNSCFGLTHYWELKQVQLKKDELDVEHALD